MQPKFWLILKWKKFDFDEWNNQSNEYAKTEVSEFDNKEELNTFINLVNTNNLISLEVVSGFSLVKRVQ